MELRRKARIKAHARIGHFLVRSFAERCFYLLRSEQRYSPHAAAWNEFDKLSKGTRGGGPAAWILKGIELLALGIRFFSVHLVKGPKLIIFMGWIALTIFAVFQWMNGRKRFLHWACPPCHSEWPGTKD
jgi:hypothetical protein